MSDTLDPVTVLETTNTDQNIQELNQKINLILNFLLSSEVATRKNGFQAIKSKTDDRNAKNETVELWSLLKKTRSKVNSIENEINRVETENLHQDWGPRTEILLPRFMGLVDPCKRSRIGRTN